MINGTATAVSEIANTPALEQPIEPTENAAAKLHPEASKPEPLTEQLKHGRQSTFMRAVALFAAINMVLAFTTPFYFDKFDFPYKGWAWWTFNDIRNSTDVNNVAILGSSLLVSAVNSCDATFLNKSLNLVSYHKAKYFDSKLAGKLDGEFNTYNLAAPGQMPSDAYMTLTAMLKTSHRPDVVVYGVAPRDFLDSSLSSPLDTEPFRFLHRLVNLDDVMHMMFRSPWAKLNWLLEREVYFYGNALDTQMAITNSYENMLNKLFPPPTGKRAFTYWDRVKLLPKFKAGEIHPLAITVGPEDQNNPPPYEDNSNEYRERYKDPDDLTYRTQLFFLKKLAELCKRERIELIVVNMPLTMDNIRILGAYQYMAYVNALIHFSKDNDVPTFDLNNIANFKKKDDFHDGVHLNAHGGMKFFNRLTNILTSTPRTRVALELAGQHLARKRSLAGSVTPTHMEPKPLDL